MWSGKMPSEFWSLLQISYITLNQFVIPVLIIKYQLLSTFISFVVRWNNLILCCCRWRASIFFLWNLRPWNKVLNPTNDKRDTTPLLRLFTHVWTNFSLMCVVLVNLQVLYVIFLFTEKNEIFTWYSECILFSHTDTFVICLMFMKFCLCYCRCIHENV